MKAYLPYVRTIVSLTEALWWFIENRDGCSDADEIFFYLRERVRSEGLR